jgi:hypothetical protein
MSDERMFSYEGMDFEALGRAYHALMPDHGDMEACTYAYLDRDILNAYFAECSPKRGKRWTLYTAAMLREYGFDAEFDWFTLKRRAAPCSSCDYYQFGLLLADAILEKFRHDPTGQNIPVESTRLTPHNLSTLTGGMRDSVRPVN